MALPVVAQDSLPISMVAAGLPHIPAKMGQAKTYAEREQRLYMPLPISMRVFSEYALISWHLCKNII